MKRISKILRTIFKIELDQNEKLIKNMKEHDKKKKIKQSKSKIQIGKRKK